MDIAGWTSGTFVHRDTLDSTSDLARRLVAEGEPALPLVVLADRQTSGRGRGSHRWWSDSGSLTFTVVLDPSAHLLRVEHQPRIALASAVAIIEALEPATLPPGTLGVRWPNDVESCGRKLGGILPERFETPRGPLVAIGIGLNVSTNFDAAPSDVRRLATSIERLGGTPADRLDILRSVLGRLDPILSALASDDAGLADRWASLDTLRGLPVRVDLGGRIVAGTGRGIDPTGGLRVEGGGEVVVLHGGQVLRG